jgi:hypothetical protein
MVVGFLKITKEGIMRIGKMAVHLDTAFAHIIPLARRVIPLFVLTIPKLVFGDPSTLIVEIYVLLKKED